MTSPERTATLPAPAAGPDPVRRPRSTRRGSAVATVGVYAVLVAGFVLTVAPFLLSVMTALKTPRQFASQSALAPPSPVTGENFGALFGPDHNFIAPLAVTAQVVVLVLAGQLVVGEVLPGREPAARQPGTDHEAERLFQPLALALGANVPIVLHVRAVELQDVARLLGDPGRLTGQLIG